MAITALNDYSVGDSNLNAIMTSLDKTYKGKAEISLSNYDADTAPVVKVGSVFENNGALFIVDTSDITPTGYAGIANSTTFYLVYDESGGAFVYSSSAPTWNDALQGWYVGNDRYFFSMYKDSGGTLYQNKAKMINDGNSREDGDRYIKGDITAEAATYSGLVKWKKYYTATNITENDLFDALKGWIPNVGDSLACIGQHELSTVIGATASIYRSSSTVILIHYTRIDNNNQATATITDGGGSVVGQQVEIMSNFDAIT